MSRLAGANVLLLLPAALLLACSTAAPATPTPSPSASPAHSPTASPTPAGSSGVIVTFEVSGEQYRVLVTDPAQIEIAQKLLAGEEAPSIPNGLIVRGGDGGVNTGWSWHIDPDDFAFADMTTEVCDGRPSYVEDGSLSGDRFCPWSATVVAVEPGP